MLEVDETENPPAGDQAAGNQATGDQATGDQAADDHAAGDQGADDQAAMLAELAGGHWGALSHTEAGAGDPKREEWRAPMSLRYLIAAAFPFSAAMSRWLSISPGAPGFPYAHRVLVSLGLAWVIVRILVGKKQSGTTWLTLAFFLAVATWGFASVTWSLDPEIALSRTIGLLIQSGGLVCMVALVHFDPASLRWMRIGILTAGGVEVLISAWEIATRRHLVDLVGQRWRLPFRGYPVGTFVNPNNLAIFMALVIVSAAVILFARRSIGMKILMSLLIGVSVLIIIKAQALGVALLLGLVAFVYLLQLVRKHLGFLILGLLAGITLLVFLSLFELIDLSVVTDQLIQPGQITSATTRWNSYVFALNLLWHSGGLGLGAGSYEVLAQRAANTLSGANAPLLNPHNTILEFALSYGLIVALPIIVVVIIATARAFRALQANRFSYTRLLGIEALMVLLVVLAGSLLASSLMVETTWWMAIGYIVCLGEVINTRLAAAPTGAGDTTR